MEFLTLPSEILYGILEFLPVEWLENPRPLHERTPRVPGTADLYWFLNLRLVCKHLDFIVIDRFLTVIGKKEIDPEGREYQAYGPPTRSSMALGKRLLTEIVQKCHLKPYNDECPFELVNTILDGTEGAVGFLARDGGAGSKDDLKKLREDYFDALISVFTVRLLPNPTDAIAWGVHEYAPEEVEGGWCAAALVGASYLGRIDDMKCFINLVDEDESVSKFQLMPLVLAAAALGGQLEAVKFLSDDHRVHFHRRVGSRRNTAMHFAALGGHAHVVAFLLTRCTYSDLVNDIRESPLLWAICGGHADVVREFISTEESVRYILYTGTGLDNHHMLPWALQGGFEDVVVELLKSKMITVNAMEIYLWPSNMTALGIAAAHCGENIFNLLFADPSAEKDDICVFQGALMGGNVNIVRTVLDAAPNAVATYESKYNTPAIIDVAQKTQCPEELLRYMLSRKDVDVNHPCDGQDTVLRAAIRSGDMDKVRTVLDHPDLDVNQLSCYNVNHRGTVLDVTLHDTNTTKAGKLPFLKALIARPDLNVNYHGDPFGFTAFGVATIQDWPEVLQLLLERGDVDKLPIDRHGYTPLMLAAESDCRNALDLLLRVPETLTDIWHRNKDSKTALQCAAANAHVEVVRRLLDPVLGATREIIQEAIDETQAQIQEPLPDGESMERAKSVLEILRERLDSWID